MIPECIFSDAPGYQEDFQGFPLSLADFYQNPESYRAAPFCIFGNLYYVGNKKVCMHLVDTGAGLILFDTGYGNDREMLLESIRSLGFTPADVRLVIHSHGHFDHFNSGDYFREHFGSTICMSRVDTELLEEMPERALCRFGPDPAQGICWPDIRLEDRQVITLGNTAIRCVSAPGHTYGTMAFFFEAKDRAGTVRRVGYWGGCGFLTTYRAYCRKMKLPERKLEIMGETIRKLRSEQVDIVLGNHPNQNNTIGKYARMREQPEENPFINPNSWSIFLSELDRYRVRLLESDKY